MDAMDVWLDECNCYRPVQLEWIYGLVQCSSDKTVLRFTSFTNFPRGDTVSLCNHLGTFYIDVSECTKENVHMIADRFLRIAYEKNLLVRFERLLRSDLKEEAACSETTDIAMEESLVVKASYGLCKRPRRTVRPPRNFNLL